VEPVAIFLLLLTVVAFIDDLIRVWRDR